MKITHGGIEIPPGKRGLILPIPCASISLVVGGYEPTTASGHSETFTLPHAMTTRTNFILVDSENVSITPEQAGLIAGDNFRLILFFNAQKKTIPVELWDQLQPLGDRVKRVTMQGQGHNALDFILSFELGRLVEAFPDAFFHIISKDKGFDPLVAHLQSQKIFSDRLDSISDIPLLRPIPRTVASRASLYLDNLRTNTKPRKIARLKSSVSAFFRKELPEEDIDAILSELEKLGVREVNGRVFYPGENEEI